MSNKEYIFVIDDEPDVCTMIARVLSSLSDYQVEPFLSCGEAQAFLDKPENEGVRVALVVIDEELPGGIRGSKWLRELTKRFPRVRKILVTGKADFKDLEYAVNEADIHGFLRKPWKNEELLKLVKRELEERNKQEEDEIVRAVSEWVEKHPRPDTKLMVAGTEEYSPRDILEHIAAGTDFGRRQRRTLIKMTVDMLSRAKVAGSS
jgi:DNA-binding NtrC family response regulator